MEKWEVNKMCKSILENGYGRVPKRVLTDKNLTITSKGIYTLLSVFKSENKIATPKRETIMEYLGIGSKNTFYKHLKPLVDYGYIKVEQCIEVNKFTSNNYIIFDKIEIGEETVDVWSDGFSIVPKKVIKDKSIGIASKVVYAFLVSYRVKSFPSCKLIKDKVGISDSKLYDALKELEKSIYIIRENNTDKGKFATNTYNIIGFDEFNDECLIEKLNKTKSDNQPIINAPLEHGNQEEEKEQIIRSERKAIKKREQVISEKKTFNKNYARAEKTLRNNLNMSELESKLIKAKEISEKSTQFQSHINILQSELTFFQSTINYLLDFLFNNQGEVVIGEHKVKMEVLQELVFSLDYELLSEVYNNISMQSGFIKNMKRYTLTAIYKALTTPRLVVVS